jgi:hypothetical protein
VQEAGQPAVLGSLKAASGVLSAVDRQDLQARARGRRG